MPDDGLTAAERLIAVAGIDPARGLAAFEEKAKKVAQLRTKEAEILGTLAAYRSRFWRDGTFNHERKALLATIMEDRRSALESAGQKVVEAALDSYARASKTYRDWLTEAAAERRRMHELDAELALVRAKTEYAEGQQELAHQRLRLNEEIIRFARAEAYVTK